MISSRIKFAGFILAVIVPVVFIVTPKDDMSCVTSRSKDIVNGVSMEPLIRSGASITAWYGFYECNEVQRGDVVLVRVTHHKDPFIKIVRIIPGDSFEVKKVADDHWQIWVNGAALKNSDGRAYDLSDSRQALLTIFANQYGGVLPEGVYMVFGEDPAGTLDSTKFGPFEKRFLIARVASYIN